MSFLSQIKQGSVLIRSHRGMAGLHQQVTLEESHEDSLEITNHPVEQGAAISDHAFKRARTVSIRAGMSDSSLVGGQNPAKEFYELLLKLQESRMPFDIVTGKRLYTNMLLESLSVGTNQDTENSLVFNAQCREVILVQTQVSTVAPRGDHAFPGKTGGTTDKGRLQALKG